MRYAVIMAGGSGKRLWPQSRQNCPKQLLRLVDGKSLMEIAIERLDGIFKPENIFVITNKDYADQVAEVLPHIPRENIVGEPVGRDTANAIALGAEILAGKNENATMAVFTADHVIRPQERFTESVKLAMDTAEAQPDALLTFGIRPSWPHTGLGYIECGDKDSNGVYKVESFKEKPEHSTARQYVESGRYFWNSGMFVWTLGAIRSGIKEFLPDSFEKLSPIAPAVREGKDIAALLEKIYPTLEKISIDYAIMEKAPKVLMVDLGCEWIDLGSWPALEEVLQQDTHGNIVLAENYVVMDSFRNIIVAAGQHMISLLGIDDCIVIHSDDATLVCKKSDDQRLKELVSAIEKHFGDRFL